MDGIQAIIERAAADPEFLARLAADPLGAVRAEGYQVSADEVRQMLGLAEASEAELVEALQQRLSHAGKGGVSAGPGYWGGSGLIGNTGAA